MELAKEVAKRRSKIKSNGEETKKQKRQQNGEKSGGNTGDAADLKLLVASLKRKAAGNGVVQGGDDKKSRRL